MAASTSRETLQGSNNFGPSSNDSEFEAGADVKENLKNWAKAQEAELAEARPADRNSHVNPSMDTNNKMGILWMARVAYYPKNTL